MFVNY